MRQVWRVVLLLNVLLVFLPAVLVGFCIRGPRETLSELWKAVEL